MLAAWVSLSLLAAAPPVDSLGQGWRPQQDEVRAGRRAGQVIPLDQAIRAVQARIPGRLLDAGLGAPPRDPAGPGEGGFGLFLASPRKRCASSDASPVVRQPCATPIRSRRSPTRFLISALAGRSARFRALSP